MDDNIFLQGADGYLPIVLVSFILTIIGYGLFPLVFAKLRKKPIKERSYSLICYGVNLLVKLLLFTGSDGVSFSAYMIWTWVFSARGKGVLRKKGMLISKKNADCLADNKEPVTQAVPDESVKAPDIEPVVKIIPTTAGIEKADEVKPQIRFCRACGFKLAEGSRFCSRCGTKIVDVHSAVN